MKRFKQSKVVPAGFDPALLQYCQTLLANQPGGHRLGWNDREVFAAFDGCWLTSEFYPVAQPQADGYQAVYMAARLRIHGQFGQTLPADWLFAMNYAESKAVALLKLIRILHLLNHLGRNGRALPLRIDLDPRICHAFSDRIVDFTTQLLQGLGLASSQVLFLLFIDRDTTDVGRALMQRYREHAHQVGLGGFGESPHDLHRLWLLEPDFVCLAPRFIRRAIMYPQVREQLLQLMPQLVEQGYVLGVEEIVCGNMLGIARQMRARFYAGQWVAQQLAANEAPITLTIREPGNTDIALPG